MRFLAGDTLAVHSLCAKRVLSLYIVPEFLIDVMLRLGPVPQTSLAASLRSQRRLSPASVDIVRRVVSTFQGVLG